MSFLNFRLYFENNDPEVAELKLQLLIEYDSLLDSKLQIEISISQYSDVFSKKCQRLTLKTLQKSGSWPTSQNDLRVIKLEAQHIFFK